MLNGSPMLSYQPCLLPATDRPVYRLAALGVLNDRITTLDFAQEGGAETNAFEFVILCGVI
jgi:hypothetical protein